MHRKTQPILSVNRRPAAGLLLIILAGVTQAQTTRPAGMLSDLLSTFLGCSDDPAELIEALEESGEPPAPAAPTWNEDVTCSETGLLDVHVRDMELATLLEMLSYESRTNIVSSTSVTGRVSANLYAVTLEQALAAILTPNHYSYCRYNGTVFVGTPEEIKALGPPPTTRVYRLKYITPSEAAQAVKSVLGSEAEVMEPEEEEQSGGSSGTGMRDQMKPAGVDYIIVTAYPQQHQTVEELLAELDRRPRQVLIEATVLRATLNESNEFGVDFTMLGGVDFQDVSSTSNASANLTTGQLQSRDLQKTTFNVNTQFTGNVTGGGFTFGIIKDSVAAFIRALEDVTDVVVVANPKLVALNKQEANVIVGRRDGYLTTTVTETAAVQTVEFLETGTQIRFCPVINDDGTVRLAVHPKDSNGGLTAANLPFEETTEAQADILVDDGDTVLIGGLFRERTVTSRSQIPVLGNIPWVGEIFGSRNDQTVREEVIILLTVHVLKETESEQAEFRALLDDVERIRLGVRMGLLGTGRERLAQAFFHEALRQVEAGDRERALYNLRMTLNNQPKHLAALKLKEQLLGERLWDDEGTRMRTFVLELLQAENPGGQPVEPPFGRPRWPLETLPPLDSTSTPQESAP